MSQSYPALTGLQMWHFQAKKMSRFLVKGKCGVPTFDQNSWGRGGIHLPEFWENGKKDFKYA